MTAVFARPDYHEALNNLSDRHLLRNLAYVGGRWTGSRTGANFEVTDPGSGTSLAWVASLGAQETKQAIDAAQQALSQWRELLPQERAAILRKWFELMLAAKHDLALIMPLEQGKPLSESIVEIDYAASFVEWFAEEGKRLNAESITSHLAGAEMIVRREALGVVGIVTPWNFPSAMITRKAAAALAAGWTVVALPSSKTPLSALALAELGERAVMPAGVFNVVTGDATTIVGCLNADARVRALSSGHRQGRRTGYRCTGPRCDTSDRRQAPQGWPLFYEPTLLADVPDDALIMHEETFGPVAAVTAFDSEDEVVARANDTEYGLVAYVVTENGARQMRLGRALEYGMVAINRVKITGGAIPFGGWKQSGLGREGSRQGIEAFAELKYLCIDTAA